MRTLIAAATVVLLAGCAARSTPPPGVQTFTGEVWTWDTADSTVTMQLENGQRVRIATTPEEIRTLRLHQFTRVNGTLAPPKDLLVVLGPVGPVTAVPKGQAEMLELKGKVRSIDSNGQLIVDSERGPVRIWVASGAEQRFKPGEPVTLTSSVQPVDLVAAPVATATAPAPVAPSASPTSQPGDHAIVTGRVLGIDAQGLLVVDSPTGPIQMVTTNGDRYRVGDAVQVRTTVRATP